VLAVGLAGSAVVLVLLPMHMTLCQLDRFQCMPVYYSLFISPHGAQQPVGISSCQPDIDWLADRILGCVDW
jgi:hypothetical protein